MAASVAGVLALGIPASVLAALSVLALGLSTLFYFYGDFDAQELSPDQFDLYRPDLAHRVVSELSYVGKYKLNHLFTGYGTADTYVMRIPLQEGGEEKYYIQFTPRFSVRKVVRDALSGKYSLHDVTSDEGVAIRAHMFRYIASGRVIGGLFAPTLDFDASSGVLKDRAGSSILSLPGQLIAEAYSLEQRLHTTFLPKIGAVTAYRLMGNMYLKRIEKALRDYPMINYLVSRFGVLQNENLKLYLVSTLMDHTFYGSSEKNNERALAFYNPRFRTVSLRTDAVLDDKEFLITLAHEVTHHAWTLLSPEGKSAWISHMKAAHPAFVEHVLERYEKIPDYFDVLSTDEFALGNEVLATFVGEMVLGLGNPALTVAVSGGASELITDADIILLRDLGIIHPDVAAELLGSGGKRVVRVSGGMCGWLCWDSGLMLAVGDVVSRKNFLGRFSHRLSIFCQCSQLTLSFFQD